eukprot:351732-Chlamydomonas_euryale.AAC.11
MWDMIRPLTHTHRICNSDSIYHLGGIESSKPNEPEPPELSNHSGLRHGQEASKSQEGYASTHAGHHRLFTREVFAQSSHSRPGTATSYF